jgi:Nucleotidyltransferase domain
MNKPTVLERICEELVSLHGVHTILLYGSRADGTATEDSDFDIAAFGPIVEPLRIARQEGLAYLDVWVYPEAGLAETTGESLRFRGSVIVMDQHGKAASFLGKIEAIYRQGPERLSANEVEARGVWARKMLARMERGDAEGNYRRVWLLQALLEDYFHRRGLWFEGPKKALRWLETFDGPAFQAYCQALEPGASHQTVAALVDVLSSQDNA